MGRKILGSDFDEFLEEEGLLEETTAEAVKRFIACQLAREISVGHLTSAEIARRMEVAYRQMAGEDAREVEALEWAEATFRDVADETQ